MIVIDCDDIDLTMFEVIDVRARIYLARLNQDLGPLVVQVNDNFRVIEVNEGEFPANQGEVRIIFIKQLPLPAMLLKKHFSEIPVLRTMSNRTTTRPLRTIKITAP